MSGTGFLVRVRRDGEFRSLDVSQLEDREIDELFRDKTKEQAVGWVKSLARWIRENVGEVPGGRA